MGADKNGQGQHKQAREPRLGMEGKKRCECITLVMGDAFRDIRQLKHTASQVLIK